MVKEGSVELDAIVTENNGANEMVDNSDNHENNDRESIIMKDNTAKVETKCTSQDKKFVPTYSRNAFLKFAIVRCVVYPIHYINQ